MFPFDFESLQLAFAGGSVGITAKLLLTCLALYLVSSIMKSVSSFRQHLRNSKKMAAHMWTYPDHHWLWGDLKKLGNRDHFGSLEAMRRAREGNGYCAIWIGSELYVEITSPDACKLILEQAAKNRKDDMVYEKFLHQWIGDGLLVASKEKWASHRRLLTPTFHLAMLKKYAEIMNDSAQRLVDNWMSHIERGTDSFDVQKYTCRLSLDILLRCIFESDHNVLDDLRPQPYLDNVSFVCDTIGQRFISLLYSTSLFHITPLGIKFARACKEMKRFSREQVRQHREKVANESSPRETGSQEVPSFLEILLTAKDENGQGLTDVEIMDECDTFMFEGHDTTAVGMMWLLYNLSRHEEYQNKCRDEIRTLFQNLRDKNDDGGVTLGYNDLDQLPFLRMCIKESLRLHSPVPSAAHVLSDDLVTTEGFTMYKGTKVVLKPLSVHRQARYWKDPDVFDPYRFDMSKEENRNRHSYSYLPFSRGPRDCIGRKFASLELELSTAYILNKFKLSVDTTKPEPLHIFRLLLRAEPTVWLIAKPL